MALRLYDGTAYRLFRADRISLMVENPTSGVALGDEFDSTTPRAILPGRADIRTEARCLIVRALQFGLRRQRRSPLLGAGAPFRGSTVVALP